MRTRHLPILTAVAMLGLVACSSDAPSSASSPTSADDTVEMTGVDTTGVDTTDVNSMETTEPELTVARPVTTLATAVTPKTVAPVTTVPPPVVDGAGAGTPFCGHNEDLNIFEGPMSDDPSDIESFYSGSLTLWLSEFDASTPPAFQADADVIVDAFESYIAALEANDWDKNLVDVETKAGDVFESAQFDAASDRINNYCDF